MIFRKLRKLDSKTIIKNSFEEIVLVLNMPFKFCHNVLIHKRYTQYHDKIGCNIFFFKTVITIII
jgi:hypothetical protein